MAIEDRDYYKNKPEKFEKEKNKTNVFVLTVIVIVILGLVLSSLRF
jgi:hypothetical protein